MLADELPGLDFRAPTVAIRVNARGSAWFEDDVALAAELRPDVVVVPKVESADDVAGLPAPAHALIETARGLVEVERIAATGGVEALVFGPGDFAASLGAPQLTIGEGEWIYPLTRIVVAARAFGRQAIDGPHVRLGDPDGLRASAGRARSLGYDGKWAIHPEQVPALNEVFSPTAEEVERAERILAAAAEGAARHDERDGRRGDRAHGRGRARPARRLSTAPTRKVIRMSERRVQEGPQALLPIVLIVAAVVWAFYH